ncbi:serine/threonine protein kinase [Planomonospora sphaerica]|uniref:Serine/threonine protein kinase n=1 Tax=Planomonospora sphaerica TaxID=161355 RepID=A0A161LAV1_9ACTN|nr:ATP-binding protein [Planomonospora sphaerica]GAT65064.1 serine/threonine protein kinase [Planomonospora sphaerica]
MNPAAAPRDLESEFLGEAYLELDLESASQARSRVREWLGPDHPHYEDVRLAASELVANAALHAGRQRPRDPAPQPPDPAPRPRNPAAAPHGLVLLTLTRTGGLLRVEVTDPGGGPSEPRVHEAVPVDRERGRGLAIVRELSAGRWGVRHHADAGRTVWCVLGARSGLPVRPCG